MSKVDLVPADPPEAKCSYIDRLSFRCSSKTGVCGPKHKILSQDFDINPSFPEKTPFSFGAFFDLFPQEHITLCDGFDIILQ